MDFSPEIIRAVLRHLDVEVLKRCLLVSHEIRELIIKTPELMRKFDVILIHETWQDKLPFIEKYGYFIRSLIFRDVGFNDDDQYKRILKQTPNVERISFIDCYIITPEEPESGDNQEENDENVENNDNPVNNEEQPPNLPENAQLNEPHGVQNPAEDEQNIEQPQNVPEEAEDQNEEANNAQNEVLEENSPEQHRNVQNNELLEPQNQAVNEQNPAINEQNQDVIPNDEQHVDNLAENLPDIVPQNVENVDIENEPQEDHTADESKEKKELPPVDTEITLNNLTYLLLESSSFAETLVKYIRGCNKLKYFKLTFYYQEPKTEFTNFVCQQDNLEELNLQGYSDMVFKSLFHVDINGMVKFKLKKLSLECELSFHRHFSNFFRAQSETIKELIISCYNIDFHFYRVIFNHFKRLEKLVLPTDWTLNDTRIGIIKECRLENVKELELVGSNDDLEIFKTFINIFPNVEQLKCENLSNFSVQGVLENFQSLTQIHVDNFRCDTMLNVKMPALKKFNMDYLCASGHSFFWEKLTEDCPNIEHLNIEEIGNVKLTASIRNEFRIIIQNLKNWKNLKTCSISCIPHDNSLNPDEDANENEQIIQDNLLFKVDINVSAKTIKLSSPFVIRCNEEVEMLKEIFKECDISEL